ncbi:MAG TPA: hypothetical protein VMV32_08755 [Ignavibacteriaceae bacterium]|nr:hypothetical protein [Ignavibacteriaceae bacterium]
MKHVLLIFWTMLMTSAWWGFGLFKYYGVLEEELLLWFAIPFIFIVVGSLITLVFVIVEVVLSIRKSWEG